MRGSKFMLSLMIACAVLVLSAFVRTALQDDTGTKMPERPGNVDEARIIHADAEPQNWMSHGRTYSEQRFSPLKQINDKNIGQLKLAWYYDLDTARGQEATPVVVDGVMYFTSAWSKVFALDAASGKLLWTYDPEVPPEWAVNACCDVVNRGVAVWKGKIIFGTLDGRLIALDAGTGKPVWQTLTIDPKSRYTITGAPRVAKGKVFIGNGGGEAGVRGYVSAYDAETGKLVWRFYTVPGDPAKGFETPALAMAAKTWTGEWWKIGGGGTVWDAIVYDPELDLLYIGVGNGSPWNQRLRSPGGGDNLFLSCIVALKPDTGEYVWHYQETPGEMWDYDADQQIVLADVPIEGQIRKVIFHAPKDGIFYVLDRATGKLISAKPFTYINWATGVDLKTGRPQETPIARYPGDDPPPVIPGPIGAHSWQPMSYSPMTGLVYIPVNESGFKYKGSDTYPTRKLAANYGIDLVAAAMPQDEKTKKAILNSIKGKLLAWNPITQQEAWAVERPGPWNGGVLSTAGNLVFEGTAGGNFEAYRADRGEKLWSAPAQTGVMAGPVAYAVNGEEYVAVVAGWGGIFPLAVGEIAFKSGPVRNISRVLVYKLGGTASLPPLPPLETPKLNPPPSTATRAQIARGERLYQTYCSACHGDVAVSGGVLPDLRYSNSLKSDLFYRIVLGGLLQPTGMVSFAKEVSRQQASDIRSYIVFRAHETLAQQKRAARPTLSTSKPETGGRAKSR